MQPLFQFGDAGALGGGQLDQLAHLPLRVQTTEPGLVGQDRQGGAVVGPVDGAGVQGLPLGEVPGDYLLAAPVQPLDEQLVRPAHVFAELALP